MQFNTDQSNQLAKWLAEGLSLSEIQKRIKDTWNLSVTYMDLRLGIDDLNLSFPEKKEAPKVTEEVKEDEPTLGSVTVELDPVTSPGSLVNGTVTFSDGVTCQWKLSQFGELGLVPSKTGYKPSQEDLAEFQKALQAKLETKGLY